MTSKSSFAVLDWWSVKQTVLKLFLDVLACDTDWLRPFPCPWRERGSIDDVWDAEHHISWNIHIRVPKPIKSMKGLKERLYKSDIAVAFWNSQKVGQNHIFLNIYHPSWVKRDNFLFFECTVEINDGLHYCKKGEIPKHEAGHQNLQGYPNWALSFLGLRGSRVTWPTAPAVELQL